MMGGNQNRLISVKARPNYRVWLTYADGANGEVDLSHLVGKGVFQLWTDHAAFERVTIGSGGELHWSEHVDLCADALYLELTGKSPGEVFPSLQAPASSHA